MTSRRDVQYQEYAEAPFIQTAGLGAGGAGPAVMVLPGPSVDYQAYAAPPQAATTSVSTNTGGIAAMIQQVPPSRLRRLPEMGTIFAFLFTPQIGGGSLSWVPLYGGRTGFPTALEPPTSQTFITIAGGAAAVPLSWSPQYPSQPGMRPIGLRASEQRALFSGLVPITNPIALTTLPWWPTYPSIIRRQAMSADPAPHPAFLPIEGVHPVPPPGSFIMDSSTLAGPAYRTVPFDMQGEFRQIQMTWRQATASQDMEPHYLEFHFTVVGVAEEEN